MTAGAMTPRRQVHYNRPVRLPYPASAETLWRDDHLYDLVVVLGHNDAPVRPGARQLHILSSDAHRPRADRRLRRGFSRDDMLRVPAETVLAPDTVMRDRKRSSRPAGFAALAPNMALPTRTWVAPNCDGDLEIRAHAHAEAGEPVAFGDLLRAARNGATGSSSIGGMHMRPLTSSPHTSRQNATSASA